jgi:hypothetical protein
MTFLKQLALAASLAIVGITGAHAAPSTEIYGEDVLMDSGAPGDFTNTWTLSNANLLVSGGGQEKGTKGDAFGDFFRFDVAESEYITFGFSSELNPTAEVSFTGWNLFGLGDPAFLIDSQGSLITNALQAPTYFLTSGEYEIDVWGTFKQRQGLFDGYILGNVPEPSSWALMLAGVGAIGALARRRKAQAQA